MTQFENDYDNEAQQELKEITGGMLDDKQTSIVEDIITYQEDIDSLERKLKARKLELQEAMVNSDIKTIKHKLATFTVAERKNIKVDRKKATMYLDGQGMLEDFVKLDETKVKKVFSDNMNIEYPFITIGEPTRYLTIKKMEVKDNGK